MLFRSSATLIVLFPPLLVQILMMQVKCVHQSIPQELYAVVYWVCPIVVLTMSFIVGVMLCCISQDTLCLTCVLYTLIRLGREYVTLVAVVFAYWIFSG